MGKHKHAVLIHKWAEGAMVQSKNPATGEWGDVINPSWVDAVEYRVKPKEKVLLISENFYLGANSISSFKLPNHDNVALANTSNGLIRVELKVYG